MRLATRIVLACASALALLAPAAVAGVPEGTEWKDAYFPSGDGTMLHADVIRPAGLKDSDKTPVILSIGPYFNHSGQTAPDYNPNAQGPNTRFADLYTQGKIFKRGYTLVQVDLRGFGASSGCNDFGGPGEQADAKAAVEWAASQPWSTGKVGMWGKSYDGWTEVMGLATKPKGLAAAVIMSPIIDGYRTLYMNGVHYDSGWYGTPGIYQAGDAQPPSLFDSPQYFAGAALGTNPACYALNILQQTAFIDRDNAFWDVRNLVPRASGSSVPVLWSHGFLDANTKPDNFMDVWSTLTGPRRAWFGQYHHVRPYGDPPTDGPEAVGKKGFIDEAMRWLDRYVKGVSESEAPVEDDPGIEVEDGGISKYRAEAQWPPADVIRTTLAIHPGTHTDQQGNNATAAGGQTHGLGIWSVSQALPYDTHIAGVPKLTLDVTTSSPRVNLFAILYDVDAANKATVLTRGAYAAKGSGKIAWELYPEDWTVKKGHHLALLLAQSDDEWFTPVPTQQTAQVTGGSLSIPFLRYTRPAVFNTKPTATEGQRPDPFELTADQLASVVKLEVPPALKKAPAAVRRTLKVSVRIKRMSRRRVVVSGSAPTGTKLVVKLRRGKRTVATKRIRARGRHYRAVFRVRAAGRYRAAVSAQGSRVHATSGAVRVR